MHAQTQLENVAGKVWVITVVYLLLLLMFDPAKNWIGPFRNQTFAFSFKKVFWISQSKLILE